MATNNNSGNNMVGWVYFAGIIMILRGVSDAFLGISALVDKHYLFATANNNLIYATVNTDTWGWLFLGLGVLVLAAGFSLLHGSNWARIFAILFMGVSFLLNMAYLTVFPIWAVVAMIINVVIIYALVVQGRDV